MSVQTLVVHRFLIQQRKADGVVANAKESCAGSIPQVDLLVYIQVDGPDVQFHKPHALLVSSLEILLLLLARLSTPRHLLKRVIRGVAHMSA